MKRLSMFCGHFGSGKTNVAINYARRLKSLGRRVIIADLDIVNPYFRTKDSEKELEAEGIEVLSIPYANTNVDLPAVPSEAYTLFTDRTRSAVLDIGGDDRGAYVLGRFLPLIEEEAEYGLYYVVNFYRYLTVTPEEALSVMREIEAACRLKCTAIINNSNLGRITMIEDVERTAGAAERLCELAGLPLAATTVNEKLACEGYTPIRIQEGL